MTAEFDFPLQLYRIDLASPVIPDFSLDMDVYVLRVSPELHHLTLGFFRLLLQRLNMNHKMGLQSSCRDGMPRDGEFEL